MITKVKKKWGSLRYIPRFHFLFVSLYKLTRGAPYCPSPTFFIYIYIYSHTIIYRVTDERMSFVDPELAALLLRVVGDHKGKLQEAFSFNVPLHLTNMANLHSFSCIRHPCPLPPLEFHLSYKAVTVLAALLMSLRDWLPTTLESDLALWPAANFAEGLVLNFRILKKKMLQAQFKACLQQLVRISSARSAGCVL